MVCLSSIIFHDLLAATTNGCKLNEMGTSSTKWVQGDGNGCKGCIIMCIHSILMHGLYTLKKLLRGCLTANRAAYYRNRRDVLLGGWRCFGVSPFLLDRQYFL